MTVIYLFKYTTRCYSVSFQNNESVGAQKFGDISDDDNNTYCVKPLETFLGKSEVFDMTLL